MDVSQDFYPQQKDLNRQQVVSQIGWEPVRQSFQMGHLTRVQNSLGSGSPRAERAGVRINWRLALLTRVTLGTVT